MVTGTAVVLDDRLVAEVTSTDVTFAPLNEDAIDAYVATGEPDDKAGAYGIQGRAGAFVTELRGSYHNVVRAPGRAQLAALLAAGQRRRLTGGRFTIEQPSGVLVPATAPPGGPTSMA